MINQWLAIFFYFATEPVKLTSTIAYTPTTFQQTIDLINEGNLKVKDVVTDEIELNDIVESGFEQLVNDKSQAKILVKL